MPLKTCRGKRGFTLIELLVVIAVILVILTIAVPRYEQFLLSARETRAAATVAVINTAERQYFSNYGRFAGSLRELGPPLNGGAAGPGAAELVDRELATGKKGGYTFQLQATEAGYSISAVPVVFSSSGSKTFYSDQNIAVHEHFGPEPATVDDRLTGEAAPRTNQFR